MPVPPRLARRCLGLLAALLVLLAGSAGPAAAGVPGPAWGWPLDGPHTVSRPLAPGPTPYSPGHRGADLPGLPGAVVRAAGAGTVGFAGPLAGRGVVVVVHGALRTTYEPVTARVHVGDAVALGAPLGTLDAGHPGCPVAACLHWGLLRGVVYLDPVLLVRPPAVRLLPRLPGLLAQDAGAAQDAATVRAPAPAAATSPPRVRASPGRDGPASAARPAVTALLGLALVAALLRR